MKTLKNTQNYREHKKGQIICDCVNAGVVSANSYSFTEESNPELFKAVKNKVIWMAQSEKDEYLSGQEIQKTNKSAREYLDETDKYVIRVLDSGKPMPKGMKEKRQEARESIQH